jgi:hypothetical protein
VNISNHPLGRTVICIKADKQFTNSKRTLLQKVVEFLQLIILEEGGSMHDKEEYLKFK